MPDPHDTRTLAKDERRFLRTTFGDEDALFDAESTCVFGADAYRNFAPPLAVVRPTSLEQVQELMAWAQKVRMPIYVRARGTNVVGSCVPRPAGIVVSTLKLNRIIEVSTQDFVAVVEPGVVTGELQKRVEQDRLFYPPDPASMKISTIGGNVSTCAGGMRALKYGVTREYVLGLTAVLPGGEIIRPGGRTHKNVVGLDLVRTIVGSEGSLAFITDITLKLLPKPESTASLLVGYPTLEDALAAAKQVFDAGILPTALEFMTRETLDAVAKVQAVPWPEDTEAALLFRLDGSRDALAADLKGLTGVLESTRPASLDTGLGPDEEEPLWEIRRMINPASFQVAPDKISDDITLPRGKLREALVKIRAIGREAGLTILTFGHLGDGNIHVNIMHNASDVEEHRRAVSAKEQVLALTLSLGGSLSGEHGVGLAKAAFVHKQLGPVERRVMAGVKHAFDPHNIMNPGKGW
ncbi:FAD-binding oxidoreductase [Oceanidesulfovibrio marinus]|uniref:FAD-binding protein n=1 Tax=Oceanidesulfovibrio marinus TaxID=370038 RepID=A0A6P1ZKQ7_9BACT|nr:FAD-linked oxidase C-terminal domain-containing protein [Oceanidesulfovibrio marinus]QJT09197.1 FAD-binding protein [Oceanidesulfovibrio marinus]TVM36373.1 FAD/FMN-containing dehydrogenase [Oceanidesulfovibrio marinus]